MAPFKDIAKLYVALAKAARKYYSDLFDEEVEKAFGKFGNSTGWGGTQKNPFKPKGRYDLLDKFKNY